MRRYVSISIVLSLILTAVNEMKVSSSDSTLVLSAETPTNSCVQVGRIASVQGSVQLKRLGWSDYQPTTVGAVLCLGDLLRPAQGARVVVQCSDSKQKPWTIPNNRPSGASSGCRPPDKPLPNLFGPLNPTRSSETAHLIPYIISPSSTNRLNNQPKLRWQAVPGANRYTLRLRGLGIEWKPDDVSTTEVVYSGESPLQPGQRYILTVEADNGEEPAEAVFRLLSENDAQSVRESSERISQQNLTDEAKALALADLYIGEQLIPEAIELLEPFAKDSRTAAIYYTLGNLYAEAELLPQAQEYFLKAEELARAGKDTEGQAEAAVKLGEVYQARGKSDAAIEWLKKAHTGYKTLGNTQRLNELEQRQRELERNWNKVP